ncbi:MAG: DUF899 family protein [Bacteroidota bacterium]
MEATTMTEEEIDQQLRELDQEIARKREEMVTLKRKYARDIPDYALKGPDNADVHLSNLFGDKDELIVVHNMGARCSYCTLWADGFNGLYPHFADRAGFVVVSPDAPDQQKAFARGRGWNFPMYSDADGDFSRDLGFLIQHEGKPYQMPGFTTFRRDAEGNITRAAKDYFGPGDTYCSLWNMFDLLPEGINTWQPSMSY